MNSQGQNAGSHLCFFRVLSVQLVESGWEVFVLPPPLAWTASAEHTSCVALPFFSQFRRLAIPRSRWQQILFLVRDHFLTCRQLHSCCAITGLPSEFTVIKCLPSFRGTVTSGGSHNLCPLSVPPYWVWVWGSYKHFRGHKPLV